MFNLFNYGAVMKKKVSLWLLFAVICSLYAYTAVAESEKVSAETNAYKLDEEKTEAYKIKEATEPSEVTKADSAEKENTEPQIITEKTEKGRIEKLLDATGNVIAEKTIEGDKITKMVLNEYYPTGELKRQITAADDKGSFYAEEYYTNGKISTQATYLNEANKIGKEKKYDNAGILRQEIPWVIPEYAKDTPAEQKKTIRQGTVITYYPSGKIAASFAVGGKGKNVFYSKYGKVIKTIDDAELLHFAKELTDKDCLGTTIRLDLESLVELYEDEGDVSYNKCGVPYRENFTYEIQDTSSNQTDRVSYDENGMIRRITPYMSGKKHGIERKYDASGNLTAEINYDKGVKEGYATGYFPTKDVAFRKRYQQGKVEGNLICYFPDGQIAAEIPYKNGLKEGEVIVKSPVEKRIQYVHGKMQNLQQNKEQRKLVSAIADLKNQEDQCLTIEDKIKEWSSGVLTNESMIKHTFDIKVPRGCEDINKFTEKKARLYCYDANGKIRAAMPQTYGKVIYITEEIYKPDGSLLYEIPYIRGKRQGWVKKYDENKKVITEIYVNEDQQAGTSRSYYPNGQVKEIMTMAEDKPRLLLAKYKEDGKPEFSLTYKNGMKSEAHISTEQKDTFLHYYNGKLDNIRESNADNPYNFIEYNLALNEYVVYQDNNPIKGGKLCPYASIDSIEANIKVIQPQEEITEPTVTQTEEVTATSPTDAVISTSQPEEVKPSKLISEPETLVAPTDIMALPEQTLPEPPVIEENEAPLIDEDVLDNMNADSISEPIKEDKLDTTFIPTKEDLRKAELASKNIGPIAKPDIEQLADVVQKEKVNTAVSPVYENTESKTEKLYYPNGNLRKTIKTKGPRTEEIKEYSKNGLLLTDTTYDKDNIVIEKYFGTGEVRRKSVKSYDDNAVMAFISREDFYDTGKPRYEIRRTPETLLFSEKIYTPNGSVKKETTQDSVLSSISKEYNEAGTLVKETQTEGLATVIKEYGAENKLQKLTVNGKDIALNLAPNSSNILKDNARLYGRNSKLLSEYKKENLHDDLVEYHANGKVKTEIIFYKSGEISVKAFTSDGNLTKFAYLAPDGKLHIEKPELRVIPSYRQRYWVDYNNPNWIENTEKYSINSVTKLNLDIVKHIMAELGIETPEVVKELYQKY